MLPLLGSFTSSAVCILVRVMYSRNASTIVRRVYDTVNMAFWALAIGVVVFLLLHIPQMREARAIAEAQRAQEISQENKLYCEKWGMQIRYSRTPNLHDGSRCYSSKGRTAHR